MGESCCSIRLVEDQPLQRSATRIALLLAFVAFASLAGCGGGGSERVSPPAAAPQPATLPPPTGLAGRASLGSVTLPGNTTDLSLEITSRYPALSFVQALWTRQIPGTNQLLVLRQNGEGRAFVDAPTTSTSTAVLDLAAQTRSEGELGLLGAAFDPNFLTNRFIYLHYNPAEGPLRSRIARFAWNGATIDLASELVILEVDQPFSNHNGGSIEFGPDGLLYIALGDGGSGGDPLNNAQNTNNLLGAILRIDVTGATSTAPYRIPADNPWANTAGSRGELWAIGLRNPFRISFDRATGELWTGDVGQGAREEIDVITGGGNYGWRVFEGTQPFDDSDNRLPASAFTSPVIDLQRSEARSITGGEVYRGNSLPALNGSYIYGDFATGNLWSLRRGSGAAPANMLLGNLANPAFFGTDSDNETLITSYTDGFFGLQQTSGSPAAPATSLSGTGLFSNLSPLTPASGLIEYAVNEPSWADGTSGQRWLAVADSAAISFAEDAPWVFPAGSLLVQQVNIETVDRGLVRLETRVLANTADGWQAFTWVWNTDQSDAQLVTDGALTEVSARQANGSERTFTYTIPSQGECLGCHNTIADGALGANRTSQINGTFSYPLVDANQLDTLNTINLFSTNIFSGNTTTSADYPALTNSGPGSDATQTERARAYLEVNCAQCHQANGPTGSILDLRSTRSPNELNAIDVEPSAGDLGLPNARIIAPGNSASSVLLERMRVTDGNRMPPVGSALVDDAGVALIRNWIDSL